MIEFPNMTRLACRAMRSRMGQVRPTTILLAALLALPPGLETALIADAKGRSNIVLVMTDNHGAWTLGCYGNPDVRTPHIDRLAAGGTLFTRAFASNPVCSPIAVVALVASPRSRHPRATDERPILLARAIGG